MEQLDLGFAGMCRETHRVLLRAILPNKGGRGAAILSAILLANIAVDCTFLAILDTYDDELFSAEVGFAFFLYPVFHVVLLPLICAAGFVLRVDDCDSGAFALVLRNLPRAPLRRLGGMVLHGIPLAISYIILTLAAFLVFLLPDSSNEVITLLLRIIGGAACLAGAAYASVVLHIACVLTVLERGGPISDLCTSRALLAGKFWAAAAVFLPLDGCFAALQVSLLLLLTAERALGLGHGFQVAAGAAIAVALWAVVLVTLAAQPVVYLVCKNHHPAVVDSSVKLQEVADP